MLSSFLIKVKFFLKYIFSPLLVIAFLWICYFLIYGNFHQVDKSLYRSAQLFPFNMPYYIENKNIKSILNLRGPSDRQWYIDELRISKEYNVTHYDYDMGDRYETSMEGMNKIISIIKDAPKPILIHCKAGADRTSLVSALYLYAIKNDKDAEREISLLYGHFPWLGSKTGAMDRSFLNYKRDKENMKLSD